MTPSRKRLILDANILVRGVLGARVPDLLERYHRSILFYTPAQCFSEARRHLPSILNRRSGIDPGRALQALDALAAIEEAAWTSGGKRAESYGFTLEGSLYGSRLSSLSNRRLGYQAPKCSQNPEPTKKRSK